ncbi:MAG: hypothetical protein AAGI25_10750 [Bacteroidota bacterium]
MKITKELLRRYGLGICTEEEKKAVEKWLDTPEYPSMRISTAEKPKADSDEIWSQLSKGRPQLEEPMSLMKARNIVLFKNVTKYAAAACILFATFFGGRFSANTANASEPVDNYPEDHLYIFGRDDTEGHLKGNEFEIAFNGKIKLFNGAIGIKTINVGDTSFNLEPYQIYYLEGTLKEPKLSNNNHSRDDLHNNEQLTGDFSILRTDK